MIKDLKIQTEADLEVFIHGGMCMSYSGRCSLSNTMTLRDANRGGCAHSCRWDYQLLSDDQTVHDAPFSMSSKDLEALEQIPFLIDSNVSSLKIEGRMKSLHYIATVVNTYKKLIDDYVKNKKIDSFEPYLIELEKAENRLASHGYLEGTPTINEQLFNQVSEQPNQLFIGLVHSYDQLTKTLIFEQRNYFEQGVNAEIFMPDGSLVDFQINEMTDIDSNSLFVARHPKQLIVTKVNFEVLPYSMIRKK
jgi:putative protease